MIIFEKFFNFLDVFHQNRIYQVIKKFDLNTIIDVGAHKGEFLSYALKNINVKKFYVFEPLKSAFQIIKKKYSNNSKIEFFNIALSINFKKKSFYVGKITGMSTLEKLNEDSKYLKFKKFILRTKKDYEKIIKIETSTIDKIFSNTNLKNSLLKIDVEGHELKVLLGAENKLKEISYLLIENHFLNLYSKKKRGKVGEFLKKHNFVVLKKFTYPILAFEDILYKKI